MEKEKNVKVELFEDDGSSIVLTDDDGKEVEFFEIACVEYEGELYAFLQPAEPTEGIGEDEVIIFRIEEGKDEEEDMFLPVDDEELLDKIFEEYQRYVADHEHD